MPGSCLLSSQRLEGNDRKFGISLLTSLSFYYVTKAFESIDIFSCITFLLIMFFSPFIILFSLTRTENPDAAFFLAKDPALFCPLGSEEQAYISIFSLSLRSKGE